MTNKIFGKYTDCLISVIESYVKYYPGHAFKIVTGERKSFVVGTSKKMIIVSIVDTEKTLSNIFSNGSWGLGETYSNGTLVVNEKDYKFFLLIFIRLVTDKRIIQNMSQFFKKMIQETNLYASFFRSQVKKTNKYVPLSHWFQTKEQENAFYLSWLKTPYTQYSSGKWDKDTKTLAQAQVNKINFYAKLLEINKDSSKKLLELGCGWGGFILYIAKKYKLHCMGLDISPQKINFVRKEKKRLNLAHYIPTSVQDIRNIENIKGVFDYIVSIGTQLDPREYNNFFYTVSQHLTKGGKALFHYSLLEDKNFIYKDDPFLQKYIFVGRGYRFRKKYYVPLKKYFHSVTVGFLPNLSYVKTLDVWLNNFVHNEKKIEKLFNKKIKKDAVKYYIRVFKHYLAFTSASFMVTGKTIYILAKKKSRL